MLYVFDIGAWKCIAHCCRHRAALLSHVIYFIIGIGKIKLWIIESCSMNLGLASMKGTTSSSTITTITTSGSTEQTTNCPIHHMWFIFLHLLSFLAFFPFLLFVVVFFSRFRYLCPNYFGSHISLQTFIRVYRVQYTLYKYRLVLWRKLRAKKPWLRVQISGKSRTFLVTKSYQISLTMVSGGKTLNLMPYTAL